MAGSHPWPPYQRSIHPVPADPLPFLDNEKSLGKSFNIHLCRNLGVSNKNTGNPQGILAHSVTYSIEKCSFKSYWESYSLPSTN